MRAPALPVTAVVGAVLVALVALVRVELPPDLDGWAPGPLAGEVVLSLDLVEDDVLVGTRRGLHRVAADGAVVDLGLPGPVHAVVADRPAQGPAGRPPARVGAPVQAWVGTEEGLFRLGPGGGAADARHPAVAVHAVDAAGATVVTGSAAGLFRLGPGGGWERLWPGAGEEVSAPVEAVAVTAAGVLFDHPGGLALHRAGAAAQDPPEIVVPGVDVVALGPWPAPGAVWLGTRGEPLLLVSGDGGRGWAPRATGLGFSAVEAVAADPRDGTRLVAGGSGLADGTGNAGTQVSRDAGAHWRHQQGRLSNTHVYALAARAEPVPAAVGLAGTSARWSLPLPLTATRWYAGTNGGGISTMRSEVPVLAAVAAAAPVLRIAEPVLAGVALLVCAVPAYRRLRRDKGGGARR